MNTLPNAVLAKQDAQTTSSWDSYQSALRLMTPKTQRNTVQLSENDDDSSLENTTDTELPTWRRNFPET